MMRATILVTALSSVLLICNTHLRAQQDSLFRHVVDYQGNDVTIEPQSFVVFFEQMTCKACFLELDSVLQLTGKNVYYFFNTSSSSKSERYYNMSYLKLSSRKSDCIFRPINHSEHSPSFIAIKSPELYYISETTRFLSYDQLFDKHTSELLWSLESIDKWSR